MDIDKWFCDCGDASLFYGKSTTYSLEDGVIKTLEVEKAEFG